MEKVLLWGFFVMTIYAFLPGIVSRAFGFRVFKRGITKKEIALTFDDGPDPTYTPELLDLLDRYQAKATFFVVGSHAEAQMDLIRRMEAEGHVIGIHNYVHKSNWIMRPSSVRRQIERTNVIIEQATGKRSIYYRPPWGIVNLFDYAKLGSMRIILWSAMFGDWRFNVGPDRMRKRLLQKVKPGEVLLLHDCGMTFGADKNAPRNMLTALESYLDVATQEGYRFVGIDEMIKLTDANKQITQSLMKKAIISLWLLWERLFHFVFRLKKVGDVEEPAFHYRVTAYQGENKQFKDGGNLSKGDRIAELHFDNRKLSGIAANSKSPVATGIRMLREVEQALPLLANQLMDDPQAEGIKAVYGVTMIHRGADRLGFEIFDLPDGFFARTSKIYLRLLMKVLSNAKVKQSHRTGRVVIVPRMLLMPVNSLYQYTSNRPITKLSNKNKEQQVDIDLSM